MEKGYITVNQAATLLHVSIQTVRRWDKAGKLKAYRHPLNNYRLYKLADIEKLAKELPYEG